MAVVLNVNGYQKMKELGVTPALLAELSAKGVKLSVAPKGILAKWDGSSALYEIHHEMLQQGIKTKNAKVKGGIETWLKKVKDGVAPSLQVVDYTFSAVEIIGADYAKEVVSATNGLTVKNSPQPPSSLVSPYVAATIEHEPVPANMMMKIEPIPLIDAKGLYRPVRGSSSGSRYFLIAVFPQLKMAARAKEGSISLRVEGTLSPSQAAVLTSLGFKNGGNYWSSHSLPVANPDDAQMFVSAILGKIGGLLTPLPDMKTIYGKGA